jgi:hypothetical protein
LDLTPEDVEAEFWAYHYADKPPGDEFEDEDFDVDKILARLETEDWEDIIND